MLIKSINDIDAFIQFVKDTKTEAIAECTRDLILSKIFPFEINPTLLIEEAISKVEPNRYYNAFKIAEQEIE